MTQRIPSKSEHQPATYKDLENLFSPSQADVETFVDVLTEKIGAEYETRPHEGNLLRKVVSGEPDRVFFPKMLSEQISGFVRIFHGWHDDDYVWHIEHASIKRPWKVSIERVVYMVAKTMHDNLPDVEARIWLPQGDWELKSISFKALGVSGEWSFHEEDVARINAKLFEILQPLV